MKIKKGDTVQVIAGKDKGKKGKVLQAFPRLNRVSVEGVNILSKHLRSQRTGQEGQRIEFPSPIHVSNVMLLCPHTNKPTRVGYEVGADSSKKTRMSKRAKQAI